MGQTRRARFWIVFLFLLVASPLAALFLNRPDAYGDPARQSTSPGTPLHSLAAIPSEGAPPKPSFARLVASLPCNLEGLKGGKSLADWLMLEAALISDPDSVLPLLLERYSREEDPAYKGLLAVLLSTDRSTHRRLLEDFRSPGKDPWQLFQGMALFAMVAGRRVAAEENSLEKNKDFWTRLVKLVDFASKEEPLKRRRLEAPWDEETGRLLDDLRGVRRYRVGNVEHRMWVDPQHDRFLTDEAGNTDDPDVRMALLGALERKWEWNLITNIARYSLWRTANADREFAGTLVRKFMEGEDRDRMLMGFDLLGLAELPPERIATVAGVARRFLDDRKLFSEAVELLGSQEGTESESILMDLYALTRARDDFKDSVLSAMIAHAGASFKPIAWVELASATPAVRIHALELLAEIDGATSIDPVVQALAADPDPEVRRSAVSILLTANRWSAREEEALERTARLDSDTRMRKLAARILTSKDRIAESTWDDWESDSKDLLNSSTD